MNKVLKFESEIIEARNLTPTVKSILLSVPDEFVFDPGQFVTLLVPLHDGKVERRSYSIASAEKGKIEVCIDRVEHGRVSPLLHGLEKGHRLTIQGPLGVFVLKRDASEKDNVFVATGTGITPFVAMIPALLKKTKKNVILIDGYKHEDEVLYADVFKKLAQRYPNFKHYATISRPKDPHYQGNKGYVQQLIEKNIPLDFAGDVYLCGLFEMIKDVGKMLVERKVNKDRIIFERYD
jgi:ferredoxin-NADP reductase